MRAELGEILAELDANEPGWRLEHLDRARLTVPAEENSYPIIVKLASGVPPRWIQEGLEGEWREVWPNEPLSPKQAAQFERRMAKVEGLLANARRLADRPRGCFAITWSPDYIFTVVPHLSAAGVVSELLLQDAIWQAHQSNLQAAFKSCRAGLNVARSLENEPLLLSQNVRAGCLHDALAGLHRILATGKADAASLLAVQKVLAEMDGYDAIAVALRGERAGLHLLCTNLENGTISIEALATPGPSGLSIADRVDLLQAATSVPASHVWIMRAFNDAIAATKLPAAEQDAHWAQFDLALLKAPRFARILLLHCNPRHPTLLRSRAQLRCAMTALAVERCRLKRGAWPADLAALVPEFLAAVPADPYTDQPLKYRHAANGISVYSVGPEHTLQGDFFDRRRPDDLATPTAPNPPEYFEFHLWDAEVAK